MPLLGGGGSSDDYEKDHSGSEKIQGLASLDLRNAFKIAMYLLYSASYPAEDIYSSTQVVLVIRTYEISSPQPSVLLSGCRVTPKYVVFSRWSVFSRRQYGF